MLSNAAQLTTTFEICSVGYSCGNPLKGHAAYAIWADGELIQEEYLLFHYVHSGFNYYPQAPAVREAINYIGALVEIGDKYNILIHDEAPCFSVLEHLEGKRRKTYHYIAFGELNTSVLKRAVSVMSVRSQNQPHIEDFTNRSSGWIHRRNRLEAPYLVRELHM